MGFAIASIVLLLAAPLAASESVVAVPAQFLGDWGGSPRCEATPDDLALRIDRDRVSYHESSGPLKAIVIRGHDELALVAELSGEGETWLATARFRLSPDGDKLIDDASDPGEETVRYRCPARNVPARTASTFAEAKQRFDAQPRNAATDAYGAAWADFNNAHHLDERDGCYFKAQGSLVQILQIDAGGKVVGYFADKDNGRSRCWRETYLGVTFPKPPFAPFYQHLEMQ
jgi:hypothetical protein